MIIRTSTLRPSVQTAPSFVKKGSKTTSLVKATAQCLMKDMSLFIGTFRYTNTLTRLAKENRLKTATVRFSSTSSKPKVEKCSTAPIWKPKSSSHTYIVRVTPTSLKNSSSSSTDYPAIVESLPQPKVEDCSKAVKKFDLGQLNAKFPNCPFYIFLDRKEFARYRRITKVYSKIENLYHFIHANPVLYFSYKFNYEIPGVWGHAITSGIEKLRISFVNHELCIPGANPFRRILNLSDLELYGCAICDKVAQDISGTSNITTLTLILATCDITPLSSWDLLFSNQHVKNLTFDILDNYQDIPPRLQGSKILLGTNLETFSFKSNKIEHDRLIFPKNLKKLILYNKPKNIEGIVAQVLMLESLSIPIFVPCYSCELVKLNSLKHLTYLEVTVNLDFDAIKALFDNPTLEKVKLYLQLPRSINNDEIVQLSAGLGLLTGPKFVEVFLFCHERYLDPYFVGVNQKDKETFIQLMQMLSSKIPTESYQKFSNAMASSVV